MALRWVTELLGLPAGTGGGFVTGATMANATCLAAARDAVLTRHGWDAAGQGLVGAPPVTVVVGAQVHATVRKALGLVGLGRDRACVLPADAQGRIEPRALPALRGPALVCLQAGNVNSGASDPFGAADRLGPRAGRLGARRRRVRAVGGGRARHRRAGRRASPRPTPGRPTRTSG